MSRVTTGLVFVGPRRIAPWGDRAWRVAFTAQCVEGGSQAYWLLSCPHSATSDGLTFPISSPDASAAYKALEQLLGFATSAGELGAGEAAKRPETRTLSARFRIGLVTLDQPSLLDAELIELLEAAEFDVEVFTPAQLQA